MKTSRLVCPQVGRACEYGHDIATHILYEVVDHSYFGDEDPKY